MSTFRQSLGGAGRALLRSLIPALLVLGYGLLNAKDLASVKLQATVAVIAVSAAVFRLIQGFVPQLSVSHYVADAYAKYIDAGLQAFVGTFVSLAIGILAAPEVSISSALVTGLLIAAGNAALRAVQSALTGGPDPAFVEHAPVVATP